MANFLNHVGALTNILSRRLLCTKREENLDFVQKLFLQYVREYYKKLKENNGKLFDVSPELEKERQRLLKILQTFYMAGVPPEEVEQFPKMKFTEPKLDSINLQEEKEHILMSPPGK